MPNSVEYAQGKRDIFAGTFSFASVLKIALVSGYTPDATGHNFFSDITGEVTGTGYTAGGVTLSGISVTKTAANSWSPTWASSTAYSVGQIVRPTTGNGFIYRCVVAGTSSGTAPTWPTVVGTTVTDGSVTWENAGSWVVSASATNPSWSSATISATGAVLYYSTGTASTSSLICYLDFGGTFTSTNGTFTVTLPTNPGLVPLTGS